MRIEELNIKQVPLIFFEKKTKGHCFQQPLVLSKAYSFDSLDNRPSGISSIVSNFIKFARLGTAFPLSHVPIVLGSTPMRSASSYLVYLCMYMQCDKFAETIMFILILFSIKMSSLIIRIWFSFIKEVVYFAKISFVYNHMESFYEFIIRYFTTYSAARIK